MCVGVSVFMCYCFLLFHLDEITGNLSEAVIYWKTAVVTLDTTTQNAFQSLKDDLKEVVDFGTVGQVANSLPRLLTVLKLSLVTTQPTSYTEEFLACAQSNLTSGGYLPDSTQLVTRFTTALQTRFHIREIVTLLQIVFNSLEQVGLPVHECVRSYAQLFYCHMCTHTVAGASPCKLVCDNVLAGCAGHLHLLSKSSLPGLCYMIHRCSVRVHAGDPRPVFSSLVHPYYSSFLLFCNRGELQFSVIAQY